MSPRPDVVILGAGVAGLAAAAALREKNVSAVVLEAKDRAGGRILTAHDPAWPVPVELGAEFIHGSRAVTREIARRAGLRPYPLTDTHFIDEGNGLGPNRAFWAPIEKLLGEMAMDAPGDLSFADYLAQRGLSETREGKLALGFVEGFHAARADRISSRALCEAGEAIAEGEERENFRIPEGYDRIVQALRGETDIRYNVVCREIRWSQDGVECLVTDRDGSPLPPVRARRAIVTLPLGVLKAADGVTFAPLLPREKREAIARLEMGAVLKIVFLFREPFWKAILGRDDVGFLHRAGTAEFPTWWTTHPVEGPVLTAWCGGTRAGELTGEPAEVLARRALQRLAAMLRIPDDRVRAALVAYRFHDWQTDPFSRGAYSYVGVGGAGAQEALAKPAGGVLFFAGEATHAGGENATVAGAIETGRRAATELVGER